MDVEVGIDATGDTTSSFYDGHGHPFLLNGWGMARPFRIGVTAVLVVRATRANHPLSRRGVPLSMSHWCDSVDGALERHRTTSQAESSSTPEAIEDQQQSGGSLRALSLIGGHPRRAICAT